MFRVGLRTKLALLFLILLMGVVLAVSALEASHVMRVMADDLGDSGTMLINQTFEQIKPLLGNGADPHSTISNDNALRSFLDSAHAFARGVVYIKIEDAAGSVLAAVPPGSYSNPAVPPFDALEEELRSWSPITRVEAVWNAQTYEISREVDLNGKPAATIRVGLSTGLIADELRHSLLALAAVGAVALALCLGGVIFFGGVLMRPVREMESGIEQLAAGRGDVRLNVARYDELGTLAEKFNHLSQRIRADRTQWENERGQFFNIFRSITDAVILLDATGAILFANTEAQSRLGLPAGGTADGKPLAVLLGRDHPLARMTETSYSVGSEVHDVALELGENGSAGRFLVSIFSLGRGPEPPGLLVIVRDLKPVQELESVVDYSGRLARLGGLISGVAHQIRNPLNAMSLQLELLSQDNERGKAIEPRVQMVRKEIRRLDQAVEALLRFMRPERLKYESVSLTDLLSEIANQVGRGGVHVDFQFDPRTPRISADRALLSEALRNIAGNAVEAMPQGGTLTLGAAPSGDGLVETTISDTGQGISAEHLEHIFQLYFTTKENGTGLGLSLASRAIDLHGGTVSVKSQVGRGTTFTVRLPLSPATIASSPEAPVSTVSG